MKSLQVYDKPMCCSSGVCGTDVDPTLVRFASDLDWLKSQGIEVERFNLAQQPMAFIENKVVHELISTQGTHCLPLILVDGTLVGQAQYPDRTMFEKWLEGQKGPSKMMPIAKPSGCCGSDGCC